MSASCPESGVKAYVAAVEYHLPERVVTNEELAVELPGWSAAKIEEKTGILERHVAAHDQCASDLGVSAAQKLFAAGAATPDEIEYLLFCTQSPDHFLPTTACIMQERLHLPRAAGAIDFNLGCSGFVYGLGLAQGLVETGQARTVLLVTADTYTRFIHPGDRSVRTLFGDAGAAVLIRGGALADAAIGPFVYGTDGSGAGNLIVPRGGMRAPRLAAPAPVAADESGNLRSDENLYMNGPEIMAFSLTTVPAAVAGLLAKSGRAATDVDLFVFHQANKLVLDQLRRKLDIPVGKFSVSYRRSGNTVSSTIPIALRDAATEGRLKPGHLVMLVGFGVGYSWGATLVRWQEQPRGPSC